MSHYVYDSVSVSSMSVLLWVWEDLFLLPSSASNLSNKRVNAGDRPLTTVIFMVILGFGLRFFTALVLTVQVILTIMRLAATLTIAIGKCDVSYAMNGNLI